MTVRKVAVVAIGRHEGERLAKCLRSVIAVGVPAVYVDSGSTDVSVAMVRGAGIDVIELDARIPFTAARARNEGMRPALFPIFGRDQERDSYG